MIALRPESRVTDPGWSVHPPDWHQQAACSDADPRLFDPTGPRERLIARPRLHAAFAYCRSCPVLDKCLSDGIGHRDSGVRGGHLLTLGKIQRVAP